MVSNNSREYADFTEGIRADAWDRALVGTQCEKERCHPLDEKTRARAAGSGLVHGGGRNPKGGSPPHPQFLPIPRKGWRVSTGRLSTSTDTESWGLTVWDSCIPRVGYPLGVLEPIPHRCLATTIFLPCVCARNKESNFLLCRIDLLWYLDFSKVSLKHLKVSVTSTGTQRSPLALLYSARRRKRDIRDEMLQQANEQQKTI